MGLPAPAAGFADPVHDAQRAFRAVMAAMAEPGRRLPLATELAPPAPLSAEMAAVALTLLDFETPFWLDPSLAAAPEVAGFLIFHTGASRTPRPEAARFALVGDGARLPDLAPFAQGEPDFPDRSATLLVAADTLEEAPWHLGGPGIAGTRGFGARPLPEDFTARWTHNHARFPLGVDLIFCAPGQVAALPRSTRLLEDI